MSAPTVAPPSSHRPLLLLVAITGFGWLACALWPRLLVLLGITDYGQWYLDSHAVLAASDAVRAGLDPNAANPLDPMLRNNKYSDWWFVLGRLGLTSKSNFLVGTVWVFGFALAAWLTVRPRNFRESIWLGALLLSPPVLLAVNRANNDLVIFTLLAICAVAAAGTTWVRQGLAWGALALATGLKFYPITGVLAFLWVRPLRRVPGAVLGAGLAAGAVLASVWPQMARGIFSIGSTLHTVGAALLWRELGGSDTASRYAGLLILTLGAVLLARGRWTTGLASRGELRERLWAALGAIVLLACFVAGVSFAYRWIFALGIAFWLWRRASGTAGARWSYRLAVGLIFFCFWSDGVFCLVLNLLLMPMAMVRLEKLQMVWRLWTQPLHWLLMIMLAGWLLEAALATWTEWRTASAKTSAA